jgi:hypothetical protein
MQPRDTVGGARDRVCERVSSRSLALRELEHGGAGLGCCGLEKAGEWAGGHAGPDVACVAGVLEQMGVDVERDGDARVAEDAADLGWVEPEVDDQVAGEGVAQVVEAKRRPAVVIQPGKLGGAREDASADIAMAASRTRTADLVGAIRIFGQFRSFRLGSGQRTASWPDLSVRRVGRPPGCAGAIVRLRVGEGGARYVSLDGLARSAGADRGAAFQH